MDLAKTYQLQSQALPGVVVTLKRIGPKKRAQIELALADPRSQQRELRMKYAALKERLDIALMKEPDVAAKMADLAKGQDVIQFEELVRADLPEEILKLANDVQATVDNLVMLNHAAIQPAFLIAAIDSINGEITYNGQPATAELLCEYGPEELFDEVSRRINEGVYVDPETAENLSLPTTSGAQTGGQMQDTIAPTVSADPSGVNETATPSTPTK